MWHIFKTYIKTCIFTKILSMLENVKLGLLLRNVADISVKVRIFYRIHINSVTPMSSGGMGPRFQQTIARNFGIWPKSDILICIEENKSPWFMYFNFKFAITVSEIFCSSE